MKTYIVMKGCYLGTKNTEVKLNASQAVHLLAAGLIAEKTTQKAKTTQAKGANA